MQLKVGTGRFRRIVASSFLLVLLSAFKFLFFWKIMATLSARFFPNFWCVSTRGSGPLGFSIFIKQFRTWQQNWRERISQSCKNRRRHSFKIWKYSKMTELPQERAEFLTPRRVFVLYFCLALHLFYCVLLYYTAHNLNGRRDRNRDTSSTLAV